MLVTIDIDPEEVQKANHMLGDIAGDCEALEDMEDMDAKCDALTVVGNVLDKIAVSIAETHT